MLNLKKGYLDEDGEYRRPIVYGVYHSDGFELFDWHMYNKGAWVLHMLRHQLGDTTFRRAVKTYLERYREREVITADLERTFEEVTGRSLAQFFQQLVSLSLFPPRMRLLRMSIQARHVQSLCVSYLVKMDRSSKAATCPWSESLSWCASIPMAGCSKRSSLGVLLKCYAISLPMTLI